MTQFDVLVIEASSKDTVHEFESRPGDVPETGDHVWVPENGEVAYYIQKREYDYNSTQIRLVCERDAAIEK